MHEMIQSDQNITTIIKYEHIPTSNFHVSTLEMAQRIQQIAGTTLLIQIDKVNAGIPATCQLCAAIMPVPAAPHAIPTVPTIPVRNPKTFCPERHMVQKLTVMARSSLNTAINSRLVTPWQRLMEMVAVTVVMMALIVARMKSKVECSISFQGIKGFLPRRRRAKV